MSGGNAGVAAWQRLTVFASNVDFGPRELSGVARCGAPHICAPILQIHLDAESPFFLHQDARVQERVTGPVDGGAVKPEILGDPVPSERGCDPIPPAGVSYDPQEDTPLRAAQSRA